MQINKYTLELALANTRTIQTSVCITRQTTMVPTNNNHKKLEIKGTTTTIIIIMIIEKEIMGTLTHKIIRIPFICDI